jgi:hypothetical protein
MIIVGGALQLLGFLMTVVELEKTRARLLGRRGRFDLFSQTGRQATDVSLSSDVAMTGLLGIRTMRAEPTWSIEQRVRLLELQLTDLDRLVEDKSTLSGDQIKEIRDQLAGLLVTRDQAAAEEQRGRVRDFIEHMRWTYPSLALFIAGTILIVVGSVA